MKKIFWGFLFIFLNININIGSSSVDIIPNFIGYIFILQGLSEMESCSQFFAQPKSICRALIYYNAAFMVLELFGFSATTYGAWVFFALGIVGFAGSVYVSYNIMRGVEALESSRLVELFFRPLYARWSVMVISTAAYLSLFLFIQLMSLIAAVTSFIFTLAFLFNFYKTQKLWYQYNTDEGN